MLFNHRNGGRICLLSIPSTKPKGVTSHKTVSLLFFKYFVSECKRIDSVVWFLFLVSNFRAEFDLSNINYFCLCDSVPTYNKSHCTGVTNQVELVSSIKTTARKYNFYIQRTMKKLIRSKVADTCQGRTGTLSAAMRTSESLTFWRLLTDHTTRCLSKRLSVTYVPFYADNCLKNPAVSL